MLLLFYQFFISPAAAEGEAGSSSVANGSLSIGLGIGL